MLSTLIETLVCVAAVFKHFTNTSKQETKISFDLCLHGHWTGLVGRERLADRLDLVELPRQASHSLIVVSLPFLSNQSR